MFNALIIRKDDQQPKPQQQVALEQVDEQQLPEGNVTVQVGWTTMNYKDALAITGASPVARSFPMVPGIGFAGTVVESSAPAYQKGDQAVLTAWRVGEKHWGGRAGLARVPGEWLVPLQAPFTQKQAMGIGTAGYTAMLCVLALEKQGITPDSGPVLVTGAAGGVGS